MARRANVPIGLLAAITLMWMGGMADLRAQDAPATPVKVDTGQT